jgi:hypothetical protein
MLNMQRQIFMDIQDDNRFNNEYLIKGYTGHSMKQPRQVHNHQFNRNPF